jgi:3-dehydroquinate synthase
MRGVRLVICPTTLEAAIDAAIGGKTAINIPGGKNLVGAFHQPLLVAIDPTCLKTLPRRDFCAGMAESIKHALLSSAKFLEWHEANVDPILALDATVTMRLIEDNIRIKADIVSKDATEQEGLRVLLNLGHTIGHAIEECCGFTLRHGECVSLGLVAACRLSNRLGMLDSANVERVEQLLTRFHLPTRLETRIAPDRIVSTIHLDKKVYGGSPRFVLLEDIGRPVVRGDLPEATIREVIQSLL